MEYYAAVKRKDSLTTATTQVDLGNMTLSETSQTPKVKHCRIPPTRGPESSQAIEAESRTEIFRDGRVTDELVQSFGWR